MAHFLSFCYFLLDLGTVLIFCKKVAQVLQRLTFVRPLGDKFKTAFHFKPETKPMRIFFPFHRIS